MRQIFVSIFIFCFEGEGGGGGIKRTLVLLTTIAIMYLEILEERTGQLTENMRFKASKTY